MAPFSIETQLCKDLDASPNAPPLSSLPGQPSILLNDATKMRHFLEEEFCSPDLEKMAPHLWILATFSSANISALHRQRVNGRKIVVTEEPRLHLVWIHNRIFIKPIPRYLLCQQFWETYLGEGSDCLGASRSRICKAATGFLRTYRYLIKHESDFNIAQEDSLRLIPKDVDWTSFSCFITELESFDDAEVSGRYAYGELRLQRLNFYAPLLLRRLHFDQVHGEYAEFFNALFGPILFAFALISTILSAMQVALAAEQLAVTHWKGVLYVSRWFSVVSLIGATTISMGFILIWLWLFFQDEWIYNLSRKLNRNGDGRIKDSC